MDWRFVLYTNLSVIYRPALLDISFDGKLDGPEHSPFRPITPLKHFEPSSLSTS
jgi:hypothetical protein